MMNWQQVLVFTRTKHGANRLSDQLNKDGLKSKAIHSDKTQGARRRALAEFKIGKTRVLVATDIMARGLDIDQLPFVVNYDLPDVPEDYIHRIGRTGRAGKVGMAVSLVSVGEKKQLHNIERLLNKEIPKEILEGYEPDPSKEIKSFKKEKRNRTSFSKKKGDENQNNGKNMSRKKKWSPSKNSDSKRHWKKAS
jgi:ATP-dependent RNA helicase RhlE